ncbi:hypothetical protein CE143_24280 [Photorhabdus luminescens]|uniref:Uncharacterized protein n=1 Tax=Photorhabdus akhurstii TaxID=171438 RepID=A0ABX8LZK1_9GAMM|nr:hypothetical protein [Photorhabdus akhurstii]KGM26131.1 hypothetical protein KS18_22590 [Photorhabdus luminescens]MBS9428322.1 hypothetical protein [Photorhabdus akhurstii]PQQ43022.1 hypothetical protein C6H65_01085 [Photorhabdus luminescens]QXF35955.1 hypothetical protein B0X70_24240 [Photorhabdus akhurstii]UJD77791.1 hypothetical protein CE143_24280 [Photorhabdus luminescens]
MDAKPSQSGTNDRYSGLYFFVFSDGNKKESSDKIKTANKTLADYKKEPQSNRQKIDLKTGEPIGLIE